MRFVLPPLHAGLFFCEDVARRRAALEPEPAAAAAAAAAKPEPEPGGGCLLRIAAKPEPAGGLLIPDCAVVLGVGFVLTLVWSILSAVSTAFVDRS